MLGLERTIRNICVYLHFSMRKICPTFTVLGSYDQKSDTYNGFCEYMCFCVYVWWGDYLANCCYCFVWGNTL